MSDASEPIDAATVVVARDSADGVEVLMLRRNSKFILVACGCSQEAG